MSWLRYLYEWQSATPYSDPNNICSAGATGYRAVSDCTGYVYCNNGYLMGGGSEYELINSVMPCPSGQLFDNSIQACRSTMTKCPTGGGGGVEKPKTRSPTTNRPTNKPIQTSSNNNRPPPPAPRQPIPQSIPNNMVDNNGEDWSTTQNNTPPRSTPSPVRPPNEQAANAIVESAISNTVDNEGEDWPSTPPLVDVNIPSPTPPPLEWIGYIPETQTSNTQSSSITQSISSTETENEKRCTTNKDCYNLPSNQQFCNQPTPYDIGYCGQCMIFNGMGCATNELCLIDQEGQGKNICHELQSGISNSQSIGITKCYQYSELNIDCQIMLNDDEAICNVEKMICVGSSKQQQEVVDSSGIEQEQEDQAWQEDTTKCNLCGDTNFNTINADSIVYFTGEDVTCNQLKDRISNMERISSDDCGVIQRSYSSTCCIRQNDNNTYGIPPSPVRAPSIDITVTTTTTTNAPSAYHYLNNWKTVQNSATYYESMSITSTLLLSFCLFNVVGLLGMI